MCDAGLLDWSILILYFYFWEFVYAAHNETFLCYRKKCPNWENKSHSTKNPFDKNWSCGASDRLHVTSRGCLKWLQITRWNLKWPAVVWRQNYQQIIRQCDLSSFTKCEKSKFMSQKRHENIFICFKTLSRASQHTHAHSQARTEPRNLRFNRWKSCSTCSWPAGGRLPVHAVSGYTYCTFRLHTAHLITHRIWIFCFNTITSSGLSLVWLHMVTWWIEARTEFLHLITGPALTLPPLHLLQAPLPASSPSGGEGGWGCRSPAGRTGWDWWFCLAPPSPRVLWWPLSPPGWFWQSSPRQFLWCRGRWRKDVAAAEMSQLEKSNKSVPFMFQK